MFSSTFSDFCSPPKESRSDNTISLRVQSYLPISTFSLSIKKRIRFDRKKYYTGTLNTRYEEIILAKHRVNQMAGMSLPSCTPNEMLQKLQTRIMQYTKINAAGHSWRKRMVFTPSQGRINCNRVSNLIARILIFTTVFSTIDFSSRHNVQELNSALKEIFSSSILGQ